MNHKEHWGVQKGFNMKTCEREGEERSFARFQVWSAELTLMPLTEKEKEKVNLEKDRILNIEVNLYRIS